MTILCLEDFKVEFDKLKSKKSYRTIEDDLINYFFNKTIEQLCSGTRLNQSNEAPYIKKRIKGRGGFRFYYLLIIKNNRLYLMYVHPKTGPNASSNIDDKSKTYLYKKVYEAIKSNDLYKIELDEEGRKLVFIKSSQ